MKRPNFFIIGAPKCGTTSLAAYLGEHPNVFMSLPKEPYFFNTDMSYQGVQSVDEYLNCFAGAGSGHIAIGEASTCYLLSKLAVKNILEFTPEAKFIVMLRNPVDASYAHYNELCWNGQENAKTYKEAWRLQDTRRGGKSIPFGCREPLWLQYRFSSLFGQQMNRLFQNVGRERVHIILFDDFIKDTRDCYERVLEFLGVPSDGRKIFGVYNRSKGAHYRFIPFCTYLVCKIKRSIRLHQYNLRLSEKLVAANTFHRPRSPLSSEFRGELVAAFRGDIGFLEKLLGRDLSHWLA